MNHVTKHLDFFQFYSLWDNFPYRIAFNHIVFSSYPVDSSWLVHGAVFMERIRNHLQPFYQTLRPQTPEDHRRGSRESQ